MILQNKSDSQCDQVCVCVSRPVCIWYRSELCGKCKRHCVRERVSKMEQQLPTSHNKVQRVYVSRHKYLICRQMHQCSSLPLHLPYLFYPTAGSSTHPSRTAFCRRISVGIRTTIQRVRGVSPETPRSKSRLAKSLFVVMSQRRPRKQTNIVFGNPHTACLRSLKVRYLCRPPSPPRLSNLAHVCPTTAWTTPATSV